MVKKYGFASQAENPLYGPSASVLVSDSHLWSLILISVGGGGAGQVRSQAGWLHCLQKAKVETCDSDISPRRRHSSRHEHLHPSELPSPPPPSSHRSAVHCRGVSVFYVRPAAVVGHLFRGWNIWKHREVLLRPFLHSLLDP
jgi:hypothetical protein